jgi:hypothetical protein
MKMLLFSASVVAFESAFQRRGILLQCTRVYLSFDSSPPAGRSHHTVSLSPRP